MQDLKGGDKKNNQNDQEVGLPVVSQELPPEWTEEELEETLYKSDQNPAYNIINEFKYVLPKDWVESQQKKNVKDNKKPKDEDNIKAKVKSDVKADVEEAQKEKRDTISSSTTIANEGDNALENHSPNADSLEVSSSIKSESSGSITSESVIVEGKEEDPDEQEEEEEEKEGPPTTLDFDLSGDEIHVVEFYAPWCPHCQHYKPHYLELANEITQRSISQKVIFHAVSCTLNNEVCQWYDVHSYPTVMGWGGATEYHNITNPGCPLNEYSEFNADTVAEDMKFDIAEGGSNIKFDKEEKFSNSTEQKEWETWKEEHVKQILNFYTESYEHDHDINDRFHNAAVSLAYILKMGVYTSRKKLTLGQQSALREFIALVEWATPLDWNVRNVLVKDLYENFDFNAGGKQGKNKLTQLIDDYQQHPFKVGRRRDELLWGYVDENKPRRRKNGDRRGIVKRTLGGEHGVYHVDEELEKKERSSWTFACTHGRQYSGMTCGLWELFHILTVGASQTENQLYGFRRGNVVTSKEVASIIRNFIANFFGCAVCKTNFLKMYDECGHDHCERLSNALPFLEENSGSSKELVLWLWEVHNAVNSRLARELADRDGRVITKNELIASKFPTKKMCSRCFLDKDMDTWDSNEVFDFLQQRYWPSDAIDHRSLSNSELTGTRLSTPGFFIILIPLFLSILFCRKDFLKRARKASSRKNQ